MDMTLEHLDPERALLKRSGVFADAVINAYIGLKMQQLTRFRITAYSVEYDTYYSL